MFDLSLGEATLMAIEIALKIQAKYAYDPSIIGGKEVEEFNWGGVTHKITVDAWWGGRRNYLDFKVERLEDDYKISDGFVKF